MPSRRRNFPVPYFAACMDRHVGFEPWLRHNCFPKESRREQRPDNSDWSLAILCPCSDSVINSPI
ncbi:hypothetical protein FRAHR75_1630007 [Frankia sp. Hr75.2]|nr:hypothetical protein FRAHR75_1630007 [Frankia sp. Hr75.2]